MVNVWERLNSSLFFSSLTKIVVNAHFIAIEILTEYLIFFEFYNSFLIERHILTSGLFHKTLTFHKGLLKVLKLAF